MGMTFGEKLRSRRLELNLQQSELAAAVGVSERSIYSYEQDIASPRRDILRRLSEALQVSLSYLVYDEVTDPLQDRSKDYFLDTVREEHGSRAAREADMVVRQARALFAGGELSAEDQEIFMQDLMAAYLEAKAMARERFTPKRKRAVKKKRTL